MLQPHEICQKLNCKYYIAESKHLVTHYGCVVHGSDLDDRYYFSSVRLFGYRIGIKDECVNAPVKIKWRIDPVPDNCPYMLERIMIKSEFPEKELNSNAS